MSFRPFSSKKKNAAKNAEAIEIFNTYNTLEPTTRVKYLKVINELSDLLLEGKRSLWDVTLDDIKKFFLDSDSKNIRTAINTFYRTLIQADYYKRDNPMRLYLAYEKKMRDSGKVEVKISTDDTANVLRQLEEVDEEPKKKSKKKQRIVAKSIITSKDLDNLLLHAKNIRDRTILIFLFATGIKLKELTNLKLRDVNIEARQVRIKSLSIGKEEGEYRTIILPRRTISFLKVYEKWRKRTLAPVPYYFITMGQTKKQMSESAITNWLKRIQKHTPIVERWTAMDFRKRALLQQYWITRDLTAVAKFGGYRRPESALRLIAETLEDQGVDSIEKLTSISEFDRSQKMKTATVSDLDNLTVTIELEQQDLDFISRTGQTPTQLIRSLLRYGGGGAGAAKAAPSSAPEKSSAPSSSAPSGGPSSGGPVGMPKAGGPAKVGMPTAGGGPNLSKSSGGGPNLSKAPSGGPNLSSAPPSKGPNLSSSPPSKGPDLLSKSPSSPSTPKGPGGPGASPPGGGLSGQISAGLAGLKKAPAQGKPAPKAAPAQTQMGELQALLAKRRAKADAGQAAEENKTEINRPAALDARVVDIGKPKKKDDDNKKDDEIPDLPDFDM